MSNHVDALRRYQYHLEECECAYNNPPSDPRCDCGLRDLHAAADHFEQVENTTHGLLIAARNACDAKAGHEDWESLVTAMEAASLAVGAPADSAKTTPAQRPHH